MSDYQRQINYQSKLKQISLKVPVEEYEAFKEACDRNGTKPNTELRKFMSQCANNEEAVIRIINRLDKINEEESQDPHMKKGTIYGCISYYAEKDEITASQFLKLMDKYYFER